MMRVNASIPSVGHRKANDESASYKVRPAESSADILASSSFVVPGGSNSTVCFKALGKFCPEFIQILKRSSASGRFARKSLLRALHFIDNKADGRIKPKEM